MDWPAEVNAGQAFRTRLIVSGICALNPHFNAGPTADQSAVTFAPYFVADDQPVYCAAFDQTLVINVGIDTAGIAPGLMATFARTYEMRAAALTYALAAQSLPVATFGDVVVRPSGADTTRRDASGYVSFWRDSLGCLQLRPVGVYGPRAALVLENQSDTSSLRSGFVRGYIYSAPAPVCGGTRVFHLIARVAN
jgi:hypothetical protein